MGTHRGIVRAAAWTGSSQLAVIVIGLIRSKVMAVLLGPGGVGLSGTYLTISGFVGGLTEMGMPPSGVRAVAEASAAKDDVQLARIATALRAAMMATGAGGTLVAALLAYPVSVMTFGSGARWGELVLLSGTVFLSNCASGQRALLQGAQKVRELARAQVVSSLIGLAAGVLLLAVFQERGIVPALLANGIAVVVVFGREMGRGCGVLNGAIGWSREVMRDAAGLMSMGVAFLFQNLVLGLGGYCSRLLIIGHGGLGFAGLYSAAWTLSGYAVQMILSAMGSDFYPRLTAAARDGREMNRLVNEQIETGVVLAAPALMGMMTLAPQILAAAFTRDFSGAVPLIQLMSFGASFRVVAWPVGYIMLARSRRDLFMASEAFSAVTGLVLLKVGLSWFGLPGAGGASALTALLFGVFLWFCARSETSFRISWRCLVLVAGHWVMLAGAYAAMQVFSGGSALVAGLVMTAAVSAVSMHVMSRMLSINPLRAVITRLRSLSRVRK